MLLSEINGGRWLVRFRFEAKNMQINRFGMSACVMKDLPNIESYLPLNSRNSLSVSQRNIKKRSPPSNIMEIDITLSTESIIVHQIMDQADHNQNYRVFPFDEDEVIFVSAG